MDSINFRVDHGRWRLIMWCGINRLTRATLCAVASMKSYPFVLGVISIIRFWYMAIRKEIEAITVSQIQYRDVRIVERRESLPPEQTTIKTPQSLLLVQDFERRISSSMNCFLNTRAFLVFRRVSAFSWKSFIPNEFQSFLRITQFSRFQQNCCHSHKSLSCEHVIQ